jgi:protein-L-isoaspartate(D-aspartate) O-methyltransferase
MDNMRPSEEIDLLEKYSQLRRRMVEEQLIPRGIRDQGVLQAMRTVPRHLFVEERQRERAYSDGALPIGSGQTISQPYMVALMTEALEIRGGEKVLEIGTGSGYQSAVLSAMGARVFSIERLASLASRAGDILRGLGYLDVKIQVGDGSLGWPAEAPFEGVIVTAGAPAIPDTLSAQLSPGGRLVIPVGDRYSQMLVLGVKSPGGMMITRQIPCVFVPLIGKFGWEE